MTRKPPEAVSLLLRRHGLRVTPQRRAIWNAFASGRTGHLTADDVYRRARARLPELSRGTVYNAFSDFVAAGLLTLIEMPGAQLYDANTASLQHFRCRSCRRLYDVQPVGLEHVTVADSAFTVTQTTILFEGICRDCGDDPDAPGRAERLSAGSDSRVECNEDQQARGGSR